MPQHVVVKEYDPLWVKEFEKEKEVIAKILGANAAEIYHIGSTAVPGLCAKPVIDIMPVVYSLAAADDAADKFRAAGYEYLGEFGIPGRRYLRKGGDERTHQVHIFSVNDRLNVERHLAVRDYLRTHPAAAGQYGELKKILAEKFPYDIEAYCNGKESFVAELEKTALLHYNGKNK